MLFQIDYSGYIPPNVFSHYWQENHVANDIREFSEALVLGTLRNRTEIDTLLEHHSTNWKLTRMSAVDRNILRMATFELLYVKETPATVVINEAIEIAKKFGTEESFSFINGILDKLAREKK